MGRIMNYELGIMNDIATVPKTLGTVIHNS